MTKNEKPAPRLMSPKEAATETSLSRVTLTNLSNAGLFPKPVVLGTRRIAFVRSEVQQWLDDRIAARNAA